MIDNLNSGLDLSILDKINIPKLEGAIAPKDIDPIGDFPPLTFEEIPDEEPDPLEDQPEEAPLTPESPPSSEESLNRVWLEWATDRGLVDPIKPEEFEDSDEFILKSINKRIEKEVNQYKDTLPAPVKALIDNWEEGVPLEQLINVESRLTQYSSLTDEAIKENPELQKILIQHLLVSQEIEPEEIDKEIESYETANLLEAKALNAQKQLIKLEQRAKQSLLSQAQAENERKNQEYLEGINKFKQSVMEKKEIIPGIPLTEEHKKAIIDFTTKPVAKDERGQSINALKKMELEDPDFLVKLAYVAGVLKWDLSAIEQKANTQAVKKLKETVKTYKEESPLNKVDIKTVKAALRSIKRSF